MWRWLSYMICAVCLLLGVATAVLWVRSYWWRDSWGYVVERPQAFTTIETSPGEAFLMRTDEWTFGLPSKGGEQRWRWRTSAYSSMSPQVVPKAYPIFARRFECGPMRSPFFSKPGLFVAVPFWALLLFFMIAAAIPVIWPLRRRMRLRRGLCEECGYDLRASSERCPECGTPRPVGQWPSTSGEAPDATGPTRP